jgi:hypothetical protein
MRGRIVAAFIAGMLFCVLILGAGVGAFYAVSGDAQAQGGQGWQSEYFRSDANTSASEKFAEWATALPATCDIGTIGEPIGNATGLVGLLAYYRCPDA